MTINAKQPASHEVPHARPTARTWPVEQVQGADEEGSRSHRRIKHRDVKKRALQVRVRVVERALDALLALAEPWREVTGNG